MSSCMHVHAERQDVQCLWASHDHKACHETTCLCKPMHLIAHDEFVQFCSGACWYHTLSSCYSCLRVRMCSVHRVLLYWRCCTAILSYVWMRHIGTHIYICRECLLNADVAYYPCMVVYACTYIQVVQNVHGGLWWLSLYHLLVQGCIVWDVRTECFHDCSVACSCLVLSP